MAQSSAMASCPSCQSEHTRRGGKTIWLIYAILIALALPPVLLLHVNAAIVAGIMIAAIVIAHLVLNERVCVDCGHQWHPPSTR
jgi:predicted lysophospholipase L1 biosynthesis ABC-type transport system permease subunit